MSKELVRTIELEFHNNSENKHKFYEICVYIDNSNGMYSVSRRHGRIGANTLPKFIFESQQLADAMNEADKISLKKVNSKKDAYSVIKDEMEEVKKAHQSTIYKPSKPETFEIEEAVEFNHDCWAGMKLNLVSTTS